MPKPLVIDLFCGLGGFSEPFIARGYRAVGFDIEEHDYGNGGYPGELVLRDIRSITGVELVKTYGVPNVIVASPPCQEFSYMAMPWSKGKEKRRKILADPAEQVRLKELFNHCFRIQREVSDAAGRYVPLIVENVRGAQEWVGKAKWNFGSFFLWGDVPALMPTPAKRHVKVGISWSKSGPGNPSQSFQTAAIEKCEGHKTVGMNWSDQSKRGQDFTRIAGKQAGIGGLRDNGKGDAWLQNGAARIGSKSNARKEASARIAKIPRPLADWIAKCFLSKQPDVCNTGSRPGTF